MSLCHRPPLCALAPAHTQTSAASAAQARRRINHGSLTSVTPHLALNGLISPLRSAMAPLAVLLVAALISAAAAQTQTDQFSCPPNYQRPNGCTIGPCRCSEFTVQRIQTVAGNTDIWFNVTNICPDPMYYVSFSIGGLTVIQPTTVPPPHSLARHSLCPPVVRRPQSGHLDRVHRGRLPGAADQPADQVAAVRQEPAHCHV